MIIGYMKSYSQLLLNEPRQQMFIIITIALELHQSGTKIFFIFSKPSQKNTLIWYGNCKLSTEYLHVHVYLISLRSKDLPQHVSVDAIAMAHKINDYWFFSTRNCFTQQFAKWSFIFPLASFVTSTMEKCVELLSKTFKPLKWTRCNNNASNSPKTCLNDKNQSIMRVRSNCTKSKLPKPSDL